MFVFGGSMKEIYQSTLFIIITLTSQLVFAVEPDSHQNAYQSYELNLKIIERLTKIEEGQKSIIVEMRTRFEAIDKRFESIDKRFEIVDQRFEAVLREMDKRFEAMGKQIEAVDKRIDAVDKRIDQMNTFFLAMTATFVSIFLAIIGFGVWDRRTILGKAKKNSEVLLQYHCDLSHKDTKAFNAQEKYQQLLDIIKKMSNNIPELRGMMQAAQLL